MTYYVFLIQLLLLLFLNNFVLNHLTYVFHKFKNSVLSIEIQPQWVAIQLAGWSRIPIFYYEIIFAFLHFIFEILLKTCSYSSFLFFFWYYPNEIGDRNFKPMSDFIELCCRNFVRPPQLT